MPGSASPAESVSPSPAPRIRRVQCRPPRQKRARPGPPHLGSRKPTARRRRPSCDHVALAPACFKVVAEANGFLRASGVLDCCEYDLTGFIETLQSQLVV